MPPELKRLRIGVIGGGAAGTLAALQLSKLFAVGHITIFDRDGRFGRGLAYSAQAAWHRLNVPAAKMGGRDDDDADGFVSWLSARGDGVGPGYASEFAPRHLYGDYLCELIAPLCQSGLVTQRHAEVRAIERDSATFRLVIEGETAEADVVILCPGNQQPSAPARIEPSPRYINDVWAPAALDHIRHDDAVLVIGTGATAVDIVLDLVHRGVGKTIVMMSRRGLLPLPDVEPVADDCPIAPRGQSLRALMRALRDDVAAKSRQGIPWQSVIDAFRPAVAALWEEMPDDDRARFLRHLRSVWLVHRHRMAPDVDARLAALKREGRLRVVAARLTMAKRSECGYSVSLSPRARSSGGGEELRLDPNWILNCTGPQEDYSRIDDPLVRSLLAAGEARPGPFGLGLDVDESCRLMNLAGEGQQKVYLIGSATRGRFWEVTAVPSIRAQVTTMVRHLAATYDREGAT